MRESKFSTEITQPRPLWSFSLSKMAAALLESEKTTLGTRLEITLLPQLNGHHLQFAILYFDYDGKKTCSKQAAKLIYIRKMFNWLWIFKIRYRKKIFLFWFKISLQNRVYLNLKSEEMWQAVKRTDCR